MKYYEPVLTRRENDIMCILWDADKPMIASEIAKKMEGLTINTVQAILRKLMKQKLVEVGEIVYSGTVLSRAFQPTLTQKEFEVRVAMQSVDSLKKFNVSAAAFASALLGQKEEKISIEELELLDRMIQEKKQDMQR